MQSTQTAPGAPGMGRRRGEITGRHVLAICVTGFGIVIAANMALVFAATGTFPGTVVDNPYHAGVGWNARADAQASLGWDVMAQYDGKELAVSVAGTDGTPVRGLVVDAIVGRPATDDQDQALALMPAAEGYSAPVTLGSGTWRVAITAEGGETPYRAIANLYVP
ncbi:MAG: FixH family protein [Pseudomonadota bacterium]